MKLLCVVIGVMASVCKSVKMGLTAHQVVSHRTVEVKVVTPTSNYKIVKM